MVCSSAMARPVHRRSPASEGARGCDRLRPSFLRRRLEQILPLHTTAGAALVDWRWDSVTKRVSGLVLEDNQLRHFRWWPGLNHFELRSATLQINPRG